MSVLEIAVVSRKTPRDGKLEITADTAQRLGGPGQVLPVVVDGRESEVTVVSMPCSCRGEANHEVHLFLESEAFLALTPESSLRLELDGTGPRPIVRAVAE